MEISKQKQERGFFWAYVAIGAIAIVGGIISVNSQINGIRPFLFNLDATQGPALSESEKRLQEIAEKQLKDTDGDTINDYDEEFVYQTSALLKDTDSDGKADNEEIASKTDPNCTEGQVCFETPDTNNNTEQSDANAPADLASLDTTDPEVLRDQLAELGVPRDVLDQVSDQDLLSVYSSVSADYTQSTATSSTTNVNTTVDTNVNTGNPYENLLPNTNGTSAISSYDDFANLDTEEIRQLLVQSGMSADELSQVDDASLQAIYQNALTAAQETQAASQDQ